MEKSRGKSECAGKAYVCKTSEAMYWGRGIAHKTHRDTTNCLPLNLPGKGNAEQCTYNKGTIGRETGPKKTQLALKEVRPL